MPIAIAAFLAPAISLEKSIAARRSDRPARLSRKDLITIWASLKAAVASFTTFGKSTKELNVAPSSSSRSPNEFSACFKAPSKDLSSDSAKPLNFLPNNSMAAPACNCSLVKALSAGSISPSSPANPPKVFNNCWNEVSSPFPVATAKSADVCTSSLACSFVRPIALAVFKRPSVVSSPTVDVNCNWDAKSLKSFKFA